MDCAGGDADPGAYPPELPACSRFKREDQQNNNGAHGPKTVGGRN